MTYRNTKEIVLNAYRKHLAIPAFNMPYLPMMAPVVRALRDTQCFGLITVARLEWVKFESGGLVAVREEYERLKDPRYTRLHLDHVPVVDEDQNRIDYLSVIKEAIDLGYESVMIDGSRLPFSENVAATREIVALAHSHDLPVEGELGIVGGHEKGPLPSYEELFASGRGFTAPEEVHDFVRQTAVDWLSVAVGNIHGAIAEERREQKKVAARLSIEQLEKINRAGQLPLVLHGGSSIQRESLRQAMQHGVAKVNIAMNTRQPYERARGRSIAEAQEAVYAAAVQIIREELGVEGSVNILKPNEE